jgi:hypothetical protein
MDLLQKGRHNLGRFNYMIPGIGTARPVFRVFICLIAIRSVCVC